MDLDAAEVEIDDHETRITALEAAGVTIVSGLVDNANVDVLVTDKVLLIKHDEKQGITCTMPATGMTQGQIISIKNMQFGDGSNQLGHGFPNHCPTCPEPDSAPFHRFRLHEPDTQRFIRRTRRRFKWSQRVLPINVGKQWEHLDRT